MQTSESLNTFERDVYLLLASQPDNETGVKVTPMQALRMLGMKNDGIARARFDRSLMSLQDAGLIEALPGEDKTWRLKRLPGAA